MQGKSTFSVHSLQSTDSNRNRWIHGWISWEYHRKRVKGGMEQYKNPDSLGKSELAKLRGEKYPNMTLVDKINVSFATAYLWALLTLRCVILSL